MYALYNYWYACKLIQIERMIKSVIPCLHGENFNESNRLMPFTSAYLKRSLCLLGRDFLPVSLNKLNGAPIVLQLLHVFLKPHFESFQNCRTTSLSGETLF